MRYDILLSRVIATLPTGTPSAPLDTLLEGRGVLPILWYLRNYRHTHTFSAEQKEKLAHLLLQHSDRQTKSLLYDML